MAGKYGLRKAPSRLSTSSRRDLAVAVLRRLRAIDDSSRRSALWSVMRAAIERDPVPWAATLGVVPDAKPKKPLKSMTAIFTSEGKGPKKEPER